MREIDFQAIIAAEDETKLNEFIGQNEIFIIKCASKFTHKYINKSDDEWSIALIAFSEAVKSYQLDKGSFFHFAKLIISRRLTDFYRSTSKHNQEILVDPYLFVTEHQVSVNPDNSIKDEIEAINQVFAEYGFTFMELADSTPRAVKTKSSCAKAVLCILKEPMILDELAITKRLPLKFIEKNAKIPRKILERHRKYIIAATLILSGEYPLLETYMRFIREENEK